MRARWAVVLVVTGVRAIAGVATAEAQLSVQVFPDNGVHSELSANGRGVRRRRHPGVLVHPGLQ